MAVHFRPPPQQPAAEARKNPALPEQDIVVNGIAIAAQDIAAEMQYHPAASAEAAWNTAAQALVIRQLLRAAMAERDLDPDDEDALDTLLTSEVRLPPIDGTAARRWHAAHSERFGAPELWEASHILIAADPEVEAERILARARAEALLAEVQEDASRLPDLARTHSDCPSARDGGQLGQVARGSTIPEFEAALAALRPGQVCPTVIASRYGMHVIQLHAHVPATQPAFDSIADRVAADLRAQSWREGVRQFIAILAGRAQIEGFDFAAADGSLVN
jgi:peptidyl-prolyl cis-trans isomerase C